MLENNKSLYKRYFTKIETFETNSLCILHLCKNIELLHLLILFKIIMKFSTSLKFVASFLSFIEWTHIVLIANYFPLFLPSARSI